MRPLNDSDVVVVLCVVTGVVGKQCNSGDDISVYVGFGRVWVFITWFNEI